jgi:hypothetical protein
MSTISAQISNDFGRIPYLREGGLMRKRPRYGKSMAPGGNNIFSMTGQLNMKKNMV